MHIPYYNPSSILFSRMLAAGLWQTSRALGEALGTIPVALPSTLAGTATSLRHEPRLPGCCRGGALTSGMRGWVFGKLGYMSSSRQKAQKREHWY